MALKIRLARGGSKKRPFYRIVVAEATSPRDGRFVERVGSYNPLLASDHADRIVLNTERVKYWMSVGAQPTDRVVKFFKGTDLATSKAATVKNNPKQAAPKKKAQERLKAEQEKTATLAKVEKEKEIDVEEEVNAEVETPGQEEAAMEGETRIEAEAEIEEEEEESEEAEAQEEIEAEEKLEIETEAEEEIKEEEEA